MSKTIELEFRVPTRLSDLTLGELQKFRAVTDQIKEATEESERFVNLKALEIFCGLELKESYNLPLSSFSSLIENINKCLSEATPLVKRFWFRGSNGEEVEFGMNPNLNELSFGEYVDLDTYMSDFSNMHKAMAVLFRPIVKKHKELYEIEEYVGGDKYHDYMKYMPANVAMGAIVFFYRLGSKLSRYTMNSLLEEEQKKGNTALKEALEENGVGINQYMDLLEGMSTSLSQSPRFHYTPA